MKRWMHGWSRRGLLLGCLAVCGFVVAAIALAARAPGDPEPPGPGAEPLVVETMDVQWLDSYAVVRRFVGRVEARQESDLGFEIAGAVDTIPVREGQSVPATTLLATLDIDRLKARKTQRVAEQSQAEARRDVAAIALQRLTSAKDRGAARPQEWDDAQAEHRAALSEVARATAAVAAVQVDINKAELRAPFEAVVAARFVDEGRVVDAGTPVLRILERSAPEVRVGVGGDAVQAVAVGQSYDVDVRGRSLKGTVTGVLPVRDRAGRGVDVILTLDATLDDVRSGDLARVALSRDVSQRGFWVPVQALTEGSRGLWSVYTLDQAASGQAAAATLRLSDVEVMHVDEGRAFVRGALDQGQRIVAGGLHRVGPGMGVQAVDAKPAAAPPAVSALERTR